MEDYNNEIEYSYVEQAVHMHLDGLDQNQQNLEQQQDTNGLMQNNCDENGLQCDTNPEVQLQNITHQQGDFNEEDQNLLLQEKVQQNSLKSKILVNEFEDQAPLSKKKKILDLDNLKIDVINYKRVEQSQEKKVNRRLLFIINISCPTTLYEKAIQVTYESFSKTIIGLVNYGYKLLSISNFDCLEMEDSQNDNQVQEYMRIVRTILQEIQQRKDLLSLEQVSEMLSLNDEKNTVDEEYLELLPAKLIHKHDIIEEELEISCSYQDSINNIVFVTQQNLTPLSRLGRIWSFIDSQILGSVLAFRIIREEGCLIPKYTLISKKYFDFRILSLHYCQERSLLLLGSHHGYLYYQNVAPNEPLNKKSNSIQVGNEEILSIIIFPSNDYALLLMPTSIRILDLNQLQIIAGGSLKKRLDGAELICGAIDKNNVQLYLGTSKGSILNYGFNNLKLEYYSTHSFQDKIPISSIINHQSYLFISQGGACTVEKIRKYTPELQLQQNGQFDLGKYMNQKHNNMKLRCPIYISKYQLFISGTDTGMIIFWSVKDGSVLSVIQVTQDQKPIVSIQYVQSENYLLVTLSEGTKILKMGKIEDSLLNEIKKNFNYID